MVVNHVVMQPRARSKSLLPVKSCIPGAIASLKANVASSQRFNPCDFV
jgi:hypothetical protein